MTGSLDSWIKEVESGLSSLPPAERARIILELDQQLKSTGASSYQQAASTLGQPQQVANRFLLDRGHAVQTTQSTVAKEWQKQQASKPVGSSARKFFKIATFAVIGFFVLLVASIFIIPLMLFKFLTVDHFEKDFRITFGSDQRGGLQRFEGRLESNQVSDFSFRMSNGQVTLTADPNTNAIVYDCEIESANRVPPVDAAKVEGKNASISLMAIEHGECEVTVPAKIPLTVNLNNGMIELQQMKQDVEANLTNGEIKFDAADDVRYSLETVAGSGSVEGREDFESAQNKRPSQPAYSATLSIGTGRIEIE